MTQLDAVTENTDAHLSADHDASSTNETERSVVVPTIAEQLTVDKHIIETGKIRVQTTVHEHEETVDEPLHRSEVSVEIVPIERFVVGSPPVARQEGDVYIVPVFEERLFVERRLFLKEEVHIRSEQATFSKPQSIVLRQTEVTVERIEAADS